MAPIKNIIEYGRLIDDSIEEFADNLTDTFGYNRDIETGLFTTLQKDTYSLLNSMFDLIHPDYTSTDSEDSTISACEEVYVLEDSSEETETESVISACEEVNALEERTNSLMRITRLLSSIIQEYAEMDDLMTESEDDELDHKLRVQTFAKRFSPAKPDLSDYKQFTLKKDLLNYMNNALYETSWVKTVLELQKIDKRLVLHAVNKGYYDPILDDDSIVIPVFVTDPAWIGEPSFNTMITGVDLEAKVEDFKIVEEHCD